MAQLSRTRLTRLPQVYFGIIGNECHFFKLYPAAASDAAGSILGYPPHADLVVLSAWKPTNGMPPPIPNFLDESDGLQLCSLQKPRPAPQTGKITPRSQAHESTIMCEFAQVSQEFFSKYETRI